MGGRHERALASDVSRRLLRAVPITVVVIALIVGLLLVAAAHWRRGASILAIDALVVAILRVALPERVLGSLAVRSRWFDVVFLLVVGGLLGAMAIGVGNVS